MPQKVQTLIFSKDKSPSDVNGGDGWTVDSAKSWASEHEFRSDKVDEPDSGESIRLRQFDPSDCSGGEQTLTENFPEGIQAVACDVAAEDSFDQPDEPGRSWLETEPEEPEENCLGWLGSVEPKVLSDIMARSSVHPELGVVWRKAYDSVVQPDDADNGRLSFRISTASEDRAGDTIQASGWYFMHYRKNPIVLFDHEYGAVAGSPPSQGQTIAYGVNEGSLYATVQFHRKWRFNEELYQMYRGGYMRAASVGFWPLERPEERETSRGGRGYNFTKQDLLEWSLVAVPMNAEAYRLAARKGIIRPKTGEYLESIWTGAARQGNPSEHARAQENERIAAVTRQLVGATARLTLVNRRVGT